MVQGDHLGAEPRAHEPDEVLTGAEGEPLAVAPVAWTTRSNGASPRSAQTCGAGPAGFEAPIMGQKGPLGPRHCPLDDGGWPLGPTRRPELVMTLPRSAPDVLSDHVQFEVECIVRMYLNVFVP